MPEELVAMCLTNRGVAFVELGKTKEALHSYDRAIDVRPSYPLALYNKASLLEKSGSFRKAMQAWEVYIQVAERDFREHNSQSLTTAREHLARLCSIFPSH